MKNYKFVAAMIVMGTVFAGGVFAQSNAVSLDAVPLFKGFIATETGVDGEKDLGVFGIAATYERLIVAGYTIGARMDIYAASQDKSTWGYFGLSAFGRWYALSDNLEKLYLETAVGFGSFSSEYDGDTVKGSGFFGITLAIKAGWKQPLGKLLFIEPSIGYVLAKTGSMGGPIVTPIGWQPGVNIGVRF